MPAVTSGSLAATGNVTLTKPFSDTLTIIGVSGTYGTVTYAIEGTTDLAVSDSSNWSPVAAINYGTGVIQSGTITAVDNAEVIYKVPSDGLTGVRLRVASIASGTVALQFNSYSFVGSPFFSIAVTGETFTGVVEITGSLDCSGAADFSGGATVTDSILVAAGSGSIRPLGLAIADPGNAGAIPVTTSGYVPLVTAGAETRTLAAPSFISQELLIYMKTFVGNGVVTCATTFNETGNNTITFSATGQAVRMIAVEEGSNLRWRCTVADGAALSTV